MQLKLALIGFGVVGQGVAKILGDRGEFFRSRYGADLVITAVTDVKKGAVADPKGLNPKALLDHLEQHGDLTTFPAPERGWDALTTIQRAEADVVVEVSWTDVKTGGAALGHLREAFACGKHVVTTNKGPMVVAPWEMLEAAGRAGVEFRFEGTVMSGTPVISTAWRGLRGCEITGFSGVLNGTTNFMLTRMEEGLTYEQALAEAQRLGYAEADPSGDVLGWDAAGKVVILTNTVLRCPLKLEEVQLATGITEITPAQVEEAKRAGQRWKLVAQAAVEDGQVRASVLAKRIPLADPLAGVMGPTNAVTFHTDLLGPVTIVGAGAGQKETAFAVISDLLDIHSALVARQR
ncbi:MAG: homoserine dehydrogenase [Thermoanaerobaculum sp.]|nr:homoserine dehydrogenase [Thermoanaerobaculum sp.]MDW7968684.1 homoserine dehydrogenase [Thermoanaerobaculum sp.]